MSPLPMSETDTRCEFAADENRGRRVAPTRHQTLDRAPQARGCGGGVRKMITIDEVCRRYALSAEEFLSWRNTIQRHGVRGLQTTKLQNYRYSRPKTS